MSDTKIICGIDPSLGGFAACVGTSLTDFRIYRWESESLGVGVDARIRRYEYLISDFRGWLGLCPDLMMIEGYSFGASGSSALTLAEFGGVLRFVLTGLSEAVEILEVPPTTLKKYITGKGAGDKTVMVSMIAAKYGHQWPKNDHYDAFALYLMGLHHAGQLDDTTALQRAELSKVIQANTVKPERKRKVTR